ncbi:hypothetical protein SAMN04487897_109139 [Paenibacillus sp. yr247]|uniref:hypothetical protein n=1 Tax=Paenibacillus sp. yr247 TaxID=1761880 RepID=UPI00088B94D4|nr:hypothetical protein [Paenibacillus sp. yr247]SDO18486.1 hypothetical protein SAMN04487897_109139 [Paenibacillus sp. yr247]
MFSDTENREVLRCFELNRTSRRMLDTPTAAFIRKSLHHALDSRGEYGGYLLTFNKPAPTFRSVDLSDIQMNGCTLDQAISAFTVGELRQEGLMLPMGTEKTNKESLLHYYMLRTGLCYVEARTRNGTERSVSSQPRVQRCCPLYILGYRLRIRRNRWIGLKYPSPSALKS